MLFGRTGELHVLSSMAEAALRGRGKAVFLGGRHGIGKSALLDAVAQMHAPSFRLLRVTGHPDESGLPFAAVERLLAPVRDSVQGLPRPQRLALRVVLGLEEGSTDPFFVRMAVTGALQAAARKRPLMVLVDDVDSLDRESAGVISFFSRRIDGAPICLVCAGTDAGRRASGKIEGERLVLGPLSQVESLAFLEWLAPSSSPETRNRVVEESGGIPLLLRDASRVLTSVRLSGREPLPAGRRAPASPAGIVPGGVDTAEPPADLVVPQGPAPGACRVRTRPDAADGHEPRPAVVRHHILGTGLSDRVLVPAAAGRRPPRAVLPFVAAEHAFAQGDLDRLAELVDETRTVGEAGMRNRYARLRAIDTLVTRSPTAAVEQLLAAARMPDADDPAFAIDTLNMAAAAAWLAGDPCALEEVHGARARLMATWDAPPPPEPTGGPVALRVLAGPWEAVGRADAEGAEDSTGAVSAARGRAASMPLPGFPMLPESGPVDASGRLLAFYVGLLRRAVKDGEWGSVPVAAYWAACLETWLGRWEHATDHLRLGLSSAERTRQDVLTGHLRSLSAWLHAVRGDVAACRAEAEACLAESAVHVTDSARLAAQGALVFAALSQGRPEEAPGLLPLPPAGTGETILGGRGSLAVSDLIEAAYRAFEMPRAREMLDVWRRRRPQARAGGTEVLMLRCEALLEENADTMERKFHQVLAIAHPNDFERARTRLLFGERLRRARRTQSAREELLAAVGTFRLVGAPLWSGRAQRELDACTVRSTAEEEGWDALTAQERQVVRLAGQGLTNRQIARALFISPRTVGYHLYKAFPKLDIRSRRQIGEVVPSVGTALEDPG
ncbi:hypothetical protein AQJ11_36085 [Streptomyces corchorusii]|uniref:HTH luxR-type domain-containing protein n=2 Tax=Streptomyces TaxID=1883 RepID=A0A101PUS8_STRCK|nr:hypothetical protein AQJ11_36085 [Streptomyces corchorusii]